ncbi:Predicted deacylase [Micrococcus lylae]|uniref:Predicted deacylase n=1 Tax=Micrococcus lylae TaxID=1273 RepID=A0A1R4J6E3_9MICC|nr:Predicted deacylase [Micrococcus lylae]
MGSARQRPPQGSARRGVVIGRAEAPLVNRGDALVHVGETGPQNG